MLSYSDVTGSYSIDDVASAKKFYGETLGIDVTDNPLGGVDLHLKGGGKYFLYEKSNHVPASFTVMHFTVDDLDKTVDDLNGSGVTTKIYGDDELPDMPNDSKGVWRSENGVAMMAWLKDPAGNVIGLINGSADAQREMEAAERRAQSPQ